MSISCKYEDSSIGYGQGQSMSENYNHTRIWSYEEERKIFELYTEYREHFSKITAKLRSEFSQCINIPKRKVEYKITVMMREGLTQLAKLKPKDREVQRLVNNCKTRASLQKLVTLKSIVSSNVKNEIMKLNFDLSLDSDILEDIKTELNNFLIECEVIDKRPLRSSENSSQNLESRPVENEILNQTKIDDFFSRPKKSKSKDSKRIIEIEDFGKMEF